MQAKQTEKNGVERKYSTSNEQFWDTFNLTRFFPDISLICFQIPWHFQVFQTSGHPVQAVCAGALSCCNVQKLSYPHRHVNAIKQTEKQTQTNGQAYRPNLYSYNRPAAVVAFSVKLASDQ